MRWVDQEELDGSSLTKTTLNSGEETAGCNDGAWTLGGAAWLIPSNG